MPTRPTQRPTLAAVNAYVRSLGELTPEGEARASIARALAEQLDQARGSTTGAMSLSLPQLSRELQTTLEAVASCARRPQLDPLLEALLYGPDATDAERREIDALNELRRRSYAAHEARAVVELATTA